MITTARLELRPLGLAGERLQNADLGAFYAWLDVPVPPSWPPPLNDEQSMRYWLTTLEADPSLAPWTEHVLIAQAPRRLVGNGGFTGPPRDGVVEIGYSILPDEQRQGFATEAVRAFVAHGLAQPGVRRVVAHTLADGEASIGVLRKCGFVRAGDGPEPARSRGSSTTLRAELAQIGPRSHSIVAHAESESSWGCLGCDSNCPKRTPISIQ